MKAEKDIKSVLQFLGYTIDTFVFTRNPHFPSSRKKLPFKFGISGNSSIDEESGEALVFISCHLFEEDFANNTQPFYLSCTIRGGFKCSKNQDFSKFQVNATAILLPYLRAAISTFTAQAGITTVILPPINVFKIFSDQKKKDDQN